MPEIEPTRDCNTCCYWRRAGSSVRGKRIPDGNGPKSYASGKCTWERGPEACRSLRVRGRLKQQG